MSSRGLTRRTARANRTALRVGLFGLLGAGNLGNDGSFEAVLGYLRAEHPDAVLGCLCSGPEQVRARYAVPATPLHWYRSDSRASGVAVIALKAVGKGLDAVRTLRWVRQFDVVIVPGMGVLEATLPLRPWGFPYSLFLLCASGRLCRTRVALVSIGADVVDQRLTRWLLTRAARLAHYRSYRDTLSKDAMAAMGVDTARDAVFPDLAFGLAEPTDRCADTGTVGVGVMAYYGANADRARADDLHVAYRDTITLFVRWLVDNGRQVRLFTGDRVDEAVVAHIVATLRAWRPDLEPARLVAAPTSSLAELMRQLSAVDTVVASRYHNVLCALKLVKPTLSISYATKNDVLMAGLGLAEFCQSARALDLDRLIEQFTLLESRREELRHTLAERNRAMRHRVEQQYAALSAALFRPVVSAPDTIQAPGART